MNWKLSWLLPTPEWSVDTTTTALLSPAVTLGGFGLAGLPEGGMEKGSEGEREWMGE